MRRRLSPGDRKKEILAAAARAFSEQSYDDVHVDAVARDAGASRALVNHYFRDKRGLFLAVIQQLVERLPRIVRSDLDLPCEEMVAANTAAWLDLIEADRRTFLLFAGGGPLGSDPEFEALVDQLRNRLVDRVLANHFGDDVSRLRPPHDAGDAGDDRTCGPRLGDRDRRQPRADPGAGLAGDPGDGAGDHPRGRGGRR